MKSSQQMANMKIYPNIFTFELLVACIQPLGALRDAIAAAKNAQLSEEEIAPFEAWCAWAPKQIKKVKQDLIDMMTPHSHTFEIIWLKTSTYNIYIYTRMLNHMIQYQHFLSDAHTSMPQGTAAWCWVKGSCWGAAEDHWNNTMFLWNLEILTPWNIKWC